MEDIDQSNQNILSEEVKSFYKPSGKSTPGTFFVWVIIGIITLFFAYGIVYLVGKLSFTWALFILREMEDKFIFQLMNMGLYLIIFLSPLLIPLTFLLVFSMVQSTSKCRNHRMPYYVFAVIGPAIIASGYFILTTFFSERITTTWMWVIIAIITLLSFFSFALQEGGINTTPFCEDCNQKMKKEILGTFLFNSISHMLALLQNKPDMEAHFKKMMRIDSQTMAGKNKPSEYAILTRYSCACENKAAQYDFHAHQTWTPKLLFSGEVGPQGEALLGKTDQIEEHTASVWQKSEPEQNRKMLLQYINEQLDETALSLVGMGIVGATNQQTVIKDMKQAFFSGAIGMPAPMLVKNADWVGELTVLAVTEKKLYILDIAKVPIDEFTHDLTAEIIEYALNVFLNPDVIVYPLASLTARFKENQLVLQGPDNFSLDINLQQHSGLEGTDSADQFFTLIVQKTQ